MWSLRYAYFTLTTFKISPSPLVFISPRGLISILLFLQIAEVEFLGEAKVLIDEKVLLVVILASMLVMTRGTMKKETILPEEIILPEVQDTLQPDQTTALPPEEKNQDNNLPTEEETL
jgi:hypothetical protein